MGLRAEIARSFPVQTIIVRFRSSLACAWGPTPCAARTPVARPSASRKTFVRRMVQAIEASPRVAGFVLRDHRGEPFVIDGPYAETKEMGLFVEL
jgi:hypothetical protein